MTQGHSDYFGSDAQRALLARGRAMFDLLGGDPAFSYYGRTVGIVAPNGSDHSRLIALARLQGNSNYADVADTDLRPLREMADAEGLSVAHYARWSGEGEVLDVARALLASRALPGDLRLEILSDATPPQVLASFAETALACGVLPPSLAVLSGRIKPGITAMAIDAAGRVVSCGAAAAFLHPAHPMGRTKCWWGMLATHPDRRGAALSLILGAEVIVRMHAAHGFTRFFTGVEPGNRPSEAICARTGLRHDGRSIFAVTDPGMLPGGRMTK